MKRIIQDNKRKWTPDDAPDASKFEFVYESWEKRPFLCNPEHFFVLARAFQSIIMRKHTTTTLHLLELIRMVSPEMTHGFGSDTMRSHWREWLSVLSPIDRPAAFSVYIFGINKWQKSRIVSLYKTADGGLIRKASPFWKVPSQAMKTFYFWLKLKTTDYPYCYGPSMNRIHLISQYESLFELSVLHSDTLHFLVCLHTETLHFLVCLHTETLNR